MWRPAFSQTREDTVYLKVNAAGDRVINGDENVLVAPDYPVKSEEHVSEEPKDSITLPENSEHFSDKCFVFTDGATAQANPGPGGAGFAVETTDSSLFRAVPLGKSTTNQVAELRAIGHALESAVDVLGNDYHFDLYSDSKYAVNCLSGEWEPKSNLIAIEEVREVMSNVDVSLTWIRGHSASYLNIVADNLAAEAAQQQQEVEYDEPDTVTI